MCIASLLPVTAFMVVLSGCAGVVALHPLITDDAEAAAFDPALVGVWETKAPSKQYTVSRVGNGYTVIDADEKTEFNMQLLKKEGRYFLDAQPSEEGLLPAHLLFRVRIERDTARVAELEQSRLLEFLKKNGRIRFDLLTEDHDRIVLISSTAEMRTELLPYMLTDAAWGEETALERRK